MKKNYPKAYKEVLEILKYMPKEDVKKIPQILIDTFEDKKDITYDFVINENQNFSKIILLDETKAILVNIYRDYWATPQEKEKIIAKQRYDMEKIEEEKRNKYNRLDIFKEKNNQTIEEESNNLPTKYKNKFYQRFVDFIKKLLNIGSV